MAVQSKNGSPFPPGADAAGTTRDPAAPKGRIAIATPVSRGASSAHGSQELERAAKRLLAAVGRDTSAARGWTPYSDGDSNTSIKGPAGTNVNLGDVLAEALAPLGYARVEKLTFRAEWSTRDVEHVLRFDTYGNPKEFLTADAGLRNNEAEAFAKQCKGRYAHPMFLQAKSQDGYWNSPWFCPMHFSLGELLRWGLRSSINLAGKTFRTSRRSHRSGRAVQATAARRRNPNDRVFARLSRTRRGTASLDYARPFLPRGAGRVSGRKAWPAPGRNKRPLASARGASRQWDRHLPVHSRDLYRPHPRRRSSRCRASCDLARAVFRLSRASAVRASQA